jgi:hypothetical protein
LEDVPSPEFFVNVASKGFSDSVSGLESAPAGYFVGVDFKEDREVTGSGALRSAGAAPRSAVKLGDLGARVSGRGKKENAKACSPDPHPGCFLQEWQAKDLRLMWFVRVAGKGLTDMLFCESKQQLEG